MNVLEKFKDMSIDEIKTAYKNMSNNVAVGCLNLSGEFNVGIMVRAASLFGVEKFYIMGRKVYDKRTSVGCHTHMPVQVIRVTTGHHNEYLDDAAAKDEIVKLQEKYTIVFVEQSSASICLMKMKKSINFVLPPLFIFGTESDGVPKSLLEIPGTYCVEIPQYGVGRSFNVSTACGIVLYEWFRDIKE